MKQNSKIFMSTHEKMLHQKRLIKNSGNPVAAVISQTMQEPLRDIHGSSSIVNAVKVNAPKHKRNDYKNAGLDARVYLHRNGTVCSDYSMNSLGSFDNRKNRASINGAYQSKDYQTQLLNDKIMTSHLREFSPENN